MAKTRQSISKKLRFEVFKRDGFTCQYCGNTPPNIVLHLDHIMPVAADGGNEIDNLITSCQPCNQGKSDTLLTDIPKGLQDKAAEIAEREDQIKGYYEVIRLKAERIENEVWEIASALDPEAREGFPKSDFNTIKRFLEQLPFHVVLEAMEIASDKIRNNKYAFKYFCGICWNKIREGKNG